MIPIYPIFNHTRDLICEQFEGLIIVKALQSQKVQAPTFLVARIVPSNNQASMHSSMSAKLSEQVY